LDVVNTNGLSVFSSFSALYGLLVLLYMVMDYLCKLNSLLLHWIPDAIHGKECTNGFSLNDDSHLNLHLNNKNFQFLKFPMSEGVGGWVPLLPLCDVHALTCASEES
jgi:hypothetical protein